jgi:hypothetical protein
LLVRLKVFNNEQMNQAVFSARMKTRRYTTRESKATRAWPHYGLLDTVVARVKGRDIRREVVVLRE